ncbi:hydroxyacylglutathione hydrolase [Gilliamella sp. wkB112]|uniref:hydroxyacylglutathione hydrolase n=1 Tax=Gilliamella sp. wkB112 TaxID=3120257 RepID=UPI00080D9313|nr:hydroxyacylglutathione hydrolase [Gilliamella apicola]OCG02847.1 hydroxyacylglutathione hydrolase [Gilliamella apicola]
MHKLHVIPALQDNYIWLLENSDQQAIIIDPGESSPVINYIRQYKITPIAILLTHHHMDHIGGVLDLQQNYPNIEVFGPSEIPLPIQYISNSQHHLSIADFQFSIMPVPGHTLGHLAYYSAPYLFCGDTLFSAGCGRIFEGTPQQMLNSLNKFKQLSDNTLVCAGHEFTKANLKFAQTLLPEDLKIAEYLNLITNKTITLPSILAKELQINLFLRCDNKKLQNKFNINNELDLFVFFRSQKDIF